MDPFSSVTCNPCDIEDEMFRLGKSIFVPIILYTRVIFYSFIDYVSIPFRAVDVKWSVAGLGMVSPTVHQLS